MDGIVGRTSDGDAGGRKPRRERAAFHGRSALAARDLQRRPADQCLQDGRHRPAVREGDDVARWTGEELERVARQRGRCGLHSTGKCLERLRACERCQRGVPHGRHAGLRAHERPGRLGDVGVAGERVTQDLDRPGKNLRRAGDSVGGEGSDAW
jgi:hypothetical protein